MKGAIAAALLAATTVYIFGYMEGDLGTASWLKWLLPSLVFFALLAGVFISSNDYND